MKQTNDIPDSIRVLARELAINHWNSSLATSNLDHEPKELRKAKRHQSFNSVFSENSYNEFDENFSPIGFTRNILIVGAGASKNAYGQLLTSNEVIRTAYTNLGIFELLLGKVFSSKPNTIEREKELEKLYNTSLSDLLIAAPMAYTDDSSKREKNKASRHLVEKFISYSFHHLGKMKDNSISLDTLLDELEFEGAIVVAQKFVEKHSFNKFLSSLLHYRYIPNLFYEIISHLFKHRFIDVIINLNFDELLDNAIEDEMGTGEFIRIYNDSTCPEFNDALVGGRLRKPLYIKPHGTISDIDSIRYSRSQYIDITPSLMSVLSSVFSGHRSQNKDFNSTEKITKQFNIITAGFAMRDPDILSVITPNLIRNSKSDSPFRTSLHIFDLNPDVVLNNLYDWLSKQTSLELNDSDNSLFYEIKLRAELNIPKIIIDDELGKKLIKSSGISISDAFLEYEQQMVEALNRINIHRINLYTTKKKTLGSYFLELYSEIQKCFEQPFTPTNPSRHLWNCTIFNDLYFKDLKILKENKSKLVYDRAKANILFDFFKFNGLVPNHLIHSDRAGKYYKLYRIYQKSFNKKDSKSLTEFLKEVFKLGKESPVIPTEMYLVYQEYYDSYFKPNVNDELKNSEISNQVRKQICNALNEINDKLDMEPESPLFMETDTPFSDSVLSVPYGASHELSPDYLDNKHFRFDPFESNHIINTNLCLTWKFYEFTMLHKDWDELHIIGNTGNAFFNLDKFQNSSTPTHLNNILLRTDKPIKSINIHYLRQYPVQFASNNGNIDYSSPISLIDKYAKCPNHGVFKKHCTDCKAYQKIKFNKIKDRFGHHKIALFTKNSEPVHAIYFFNPTNKSRINPIWFSTSDRGSYNLTNLKIVQELLSYVI